MILLIISYFQTNVPDREGDSLRAGCQPALLRPDGHRAGRGEQIQVLGQGVDTGWQGGAPATSKVRHKDKIFIHIFKFK